MLKQEEILNMLNEHSTGMKELSLSMAIIEENKKLWGLSKTQKLSV